MSFTIYPAIDLRRGQVVRLQQGDPGKETRYNQVPAASARRWLEAGARWLHVVNLDGAFGAAGQANRAALKDILEACIEYRANIQFGGGLRSLEAVRQALGLGVSRAILGTAAVERPEIVDQALEEFGPERLAAGVDARDGQVYVRGWAQPAPLSALELAGRLASQGLRWLIYTDIDRDGVGAGLNLPATQALAQASGLQVIASGGVNSPQDLRAAREAGLAGVIVGRALYEGKLNLQAVLGELK